MRIDTIDTLCRSIKKRGKKNNSLTVVIVIVV